jgi:methylthioxylose transferase
MTEAGETPQSDSARPDARRAWWSLAATLVVVGAALFVFDLFSAGSSVARRGVASHRPPIYGRFEPSFTRWGAIALVLAAVIGIGTFFATRRDRVKPAILLPVALATLISFAAAVAAVNGEKQALVEPLERTFDYQVDVKIVRALGVRTFVERFPDIAPTLESVHSRDHPPGPIVLLSFLQTLSSRRVVPRAVVLAFLSSLMLVAAWLIARRVAGERAAMYAVLLLAVAPGIVIFTFLSLDAVFGAMLAGSAALLVWGIAPERRLWFAFLGGAGLAVTSFMTYGFLWILAFAGLYALITRGIRGCIAPLAAMAGGFLFGLAVLRAGLGYDLVATYRASYELVPQLSMRSAIYWLFGDPAVWLTFAGLPLAAFMLRELVTKRPRYLIALFIPLIAADLTTIFRAETERVGIFAYPIVAVAAGVGLWRWEEGSGKRRPGVVAALVVFTALQTVALEALFYTYW